MTNMNGLKNNFLEGLQKGVKSKQRNLFWLHSGWHEKTKTKNIATISQFKAMQI